MISHTNPPYHIADIILKILTVFSAVSIPSSLFLNSSDRLACYLFVPLTYYMHDNRFGPTFCRQKEHLPKLVSENVLSFCALFM